MKKARHSNPQEFVYVIPTNEDGVVNSESFTDRKLLFSGEAAEVGVLPGIR